MKRFIRHGDVVLHPVGEVKGKRVNNKDSFVLAEGEATGHLHKLKGDALVVLETPKERFVQAEQECVLEHQEHKPLKVEGSFVQVQEREMDNFSGKVDRVAD